MKEDIKILIVDDEPAICEMLSDSISDEGYKVRSEFNGMSAFEVLKIFRPHIVLLDIWMPQSEINGMDFLKKVKKEYPGIEVVMMSGHGTIETAVRATKMGAMDFIEKPLSMDKILILIKNILSLQKEKREKLTLLNRLRENIAIVGVSPSITNLRKKIAHLALNHSCVFIQGEMSTGKRLIAQNIHYLSERRHEAFVEVNATKVSQDLMEVELFGCARNTFKASPDAKKGKCDYAQGGTLFLNEISVFDEKVQEKILTLVEKQVFTRKNEKNPIVANIRVIVSTQEEFKKRCRRGKALNSSLFKVLKENLIKTTPLRERKEDLLLLMNHFGENFNRKNNYPGQRFTEKDLKNLKNYSWPGNLNELKNQVEKTFILSSYDFKESLFSKKTHESLEKIKFLDSHSLNQPS